MMWVMWNLTSFRLETVLVSVQDWCMVCTRRTIGLENRFGHTKWYFKVMRLRWKLDSVYLEIVQIFKQDRCMVIPLARKSFWTHALERLGDVGHVDSRFSPFWRQF